MSKNKEVIQLFDETEVNVRKAQIAIYKTQFS